MKKPMTAITAVVALLAIYLLIISPMKKARQQIGQTLPARQALLSKRMDFIKKYSAEKDRINEHRKQLEALELYTIHESDPSIAAASVQSRIQDMAESAGIKINSIRALPPVVMDGYSTLPVYVDGRGAMGNISKFLKLIENSLEMLTMERLDIATTRTRGQMRIKIQVAGIMRNE